MIVYLLIIIASAGHVGDPISFNPSAYKTQKSCKVALKQLKAEYDVNFENVSAVCLKMKVNK